MKLDKLFDKKKLSVKDIKDLYTYLDEISAQKGILLQEQFKVERLLMVKAK